MAGGFKSPVTPESILAGELYGVLIKARGEEKALGPEVVAGKLRAAEDLYEHELHLFWEEKRVASDPRPRGLVPRSATAAGDYDVEQAGLNFPDDFYLDGRFGRCELAYRPVRDPVVRFCYTPSLAQSLQPIPSEWIRLERKEGRFYVLPTGAPEMTLARFEATAMRLAGYGRGIPDFMLVDYVAGFTRTELLHDHNDLLEALRITTTLLVFGILSNIRTGGLGSMSLSQDGQSRSQTPLQGKYGAYSGAVELALQNEERILKSWKRSEHGIIMAVA